MGIKHLSYLDLNPQQRRQSANLAQQQLKRRLSDPSLTAEQQAQLRARVNHLGQWADGSLGTPQKVAAPPTKPVPKGRKASKKAAVPKSHKVEITESVSVKEKV